MVREVSLEVVVTMVLEVIFQHATKSEARRAERRFPQKSKNTGFWGLGIAKPSSIRRGGSFGGVSARLVRFLGCSFYSLGSEHPWSAFAVKKKNAF